MEDPVLIDRCLGYLSKIAQTGVESREVQTKIIISSKENIFRRTNPVIMDPSLGFGEDRPNIFSDTFFNTFKNWAVLSGCICLDENGDVVAVGRDVEGYESPAKFPFIMIEVVKKGHIRLLKNGIPVLDIVNDEPVTPEFGNA